MKNRIKIGPSRKTGLNASRRIPIAKTGHRAENQDNPVQDTPATLVQDETVRASPDVSRANGIYRVRCDGNAIVRTVRI